MNIVRQIQSLMDWIGDDGEFTCDDANNLVKDLEVIRKNVEGQANEIDDLKVIRQKQAECIVGQEAEIERLKSEFSALSADNDAKRCVLDDEFEIDRKLNAKILSKDARIKELELKLQDFIDSQ